MSAPNEPEARPASARGRVRRIAAVVVLSGLVCVLLWFVAFSFFTSLMIATGCCVVVVAASVASDPFDMVLDAITAIVFGVLAAIAAIFAAIFGAIFSLFSP
jgi:hypothetical protein